VELAREMGMTLVGFLRGTSMNVYSADYRIRSIEDDTEDDAENDADRDLTCDDGRRSAG
jgi:FdhD protein